MTTALSGSQALEFVRAQGVVLASAKGSAPRLIEAILGEAITGNWWAHPPTGRHATRKVQFPFWVPPQVQKEAELLSEMDAFASLVPAVSAAWAPLKPPRKA